MTTISHLVTPGLFLVTQSVPSSAKAIVANPARDVVAIFDVSGSMHYDLPAFKRDLSNMLPRILEPGDTFSLIFFSGPGQTGRLLDTVQISAGGQRALDVVNIQRTISTLETIGMTCFTDPLGLAAKLGAELARSRPHAKRTVIFGSDGYDNTSPGATSTERRKNIFQALRAAAGNFDQVVTMGVGWGCDQGMLQDMAASCGGQFLFARDIGSFNRDFETAATKRPTGAKLRRVDIEGSPLLGLVFTTHGGEITQHEPANGAVNVPETAGRVWYLSASPAGQAGDAVQTMAHLVSAGEHRIENFGLAIEASYAALVLFAQRSQRKTARAIAVALGDARLLNLTLGAFGPQRYADVAEAAGKAFEECRGLGGALQPVAPAGTGAHRYRDGFTAATTFDPNAYTVLEALRALSAEGNRVVPDHPSFDYTPITRGRVNAGGVLTADDVKKLGEVIAAIDAESGMLLAALRALAVGAPIEKLGEGRDAVVAAAAALARQADVITAVGSAKSPAASYAYEPAPTGYPVDGLVFASEEANVSLRVVRPCVVDLTAARAALPVELRARVPSSIRSFKYAQYTVITGRVLNLAVVPAILSAETWAEFARAGLVSGPYRAEVVAIDLRKLPLINDRMIDGLRAEETVGNAFELETVKARLKVLRDMRKLYVPKEESSEVAAWVAAAGLTGEEAEAVKTWLSEVGVTDNGYSPPSASAPKRDQRRSWKLEIGIPGLSSLPAVKKVRDKLAAIAAWKKAPKGKEPKLTTAEGLLAPEVEEMASFCAGAGIVLDKLVPAPDAVEKPADRKARERAVTVLEACIVARSASLERRRRALLGRLGDAAIAAITGGEWFSDLKPGQTDVELSTPHGKLACSINVVDVDIDI